MFGGTAVCKRLNLCVFCVCKGHGTQITTMNPLILAKQQDSNLATFASASPFGALP